MIKNKAIKLVNFLVSLRLLPPLSELNGEEERLLFALYAMREQRGELSVSDVYDLNGGKSGSTAYRNLMSLKDKGLVHVTVDQSDKRKRRVTFTPSAERLFAALS